MESYMVGCLETLRETHKIFCKNGTLIASITSFTLFLHSVLFLFNFFTIKPFINDLLVKETLLFITSPSDTEFTNILSSFGEILSNSALLQSLFILAFSVISSFLAMATIQASARIYNGKTMPFKDLVSVTGRSCRRSFITLFYIHVFAVGYVTLTCAFFFPPLLAGKFPVFVLMLCLLALFLYVYFDIVWTLAIIASVVEERYGIEALSKATQIVKGMRAEGFLLNLIFTFLYYFVILGLGLISPKQSAAITILIGLFVLNSVCLIRMSWLMAYTVFYCKCKKIHGEEVEMEGTTENRTSSASTPLIRDYIDDDERKITIIDVTKS